MLFGVLPVLLVLIALREHGLGWDFRAYYSGAQSRLVIKAPHSTPISGTLRKS